MRWGSLAAVAASAVLLATAPVCRAQSAEQLALARAYLEARADIRQLISDAFEPSAHDTQEDVKLAVVDTIKSMRADPGWKLSEPEWEAVERDLGGDILQTREDLARYAEHTGLNAKIKEAIVRSLASAIDTASLSQIHAFYTSPPGRHLVRFQHMIYRDLPQTIRMAVLSRITESIPTPARVSDEDFIESGRFIDVVVDWHLLSMGLSGHPEVPTIVWNLTSWVIDFHRPRNLEEWRKIPQPNREAIVSWRASPLAKKEREGLFGLAKSEELNSLSKGFVDRQSELYAEFTRKWAGRKPVR